MMAMRVAIGLALLGLGFVGAGCNTPFLGQDLIRQRIEERREAQDQQVRTERVQREERRERQQRVREEAVARGEPSIPPLAEQTPQEERQRRGWRPFTLPTLAKKPEFFLFGHAGRVPGLFADRPAEPVRLTTLLVRARQPVQAVRLRGETALSTVRLESADPTAVRVLYQEDSIFLEGLRVGTTEVRYIYSDGTAFAVFTVDVRQ